MSQADVRAGGLTHPHAKENKMKARLQRLSRTAGSTVVALLLAVLATARIASAVCTFPEECNPATTTCAVPLSGDFRIDFLGAGPSGGNTDFQYQVCSLGQANLNHWALGLACPNLFVNAVPNGQQATCNTTELQGVRFDGGVADCVGGCGDGGPTVFTITLSGSVPVTQAPAGVTVVTRAGNVTETVCLQGPDCCADPTNCDDGNPCTIDSCSANICTHTPKVCNDNNSCTTDSCDPGTGACVFTPNNNSCDDGSACTTNDTCSNG